MNKIRETSGIAFSPWSACKQVNTKTSSRSSLIVTICRTKRWIESYRSLPQERRSHLGTCTSINQMNQRTVSVRKFRYRKWNAHSARSFFRLIKRIALERRATQRRFGEKQFSRQQSLWLVHYRDLSFMLKKIIKHQALKTFSITLWKKKRYATI